MLYTLTVLERMSIKASDGEIGKVSDTYFDDQSWTLRYLVVDTRRWLPGRKVLISPWAIRKANWEKKSIGVNLTREQVKGSPSIDADRPVSRQYEKAYFDYYAYPYYWAGPLRWGQMRNPRDLGNADFRADERRHGSQQEGDPHLRSTEFVSGYHIEAADGSIGHVQDFLYDEQDWSLRFLTVDTSNWLPGRHVLVAIESVERVSWDERKVHVSLTRDAVRESPQWHPQLALTPQDEGYLHRRDAGIRHGEPSRGGQIR